jgi:hypothetical protein
VIGQNEIEKLTASTENCNSGWRHVFRMARMPRPEYAATPKILLFLDDGSGRKGALSLVVCSPSGFAGCLRIESRFDLREFMLAALRATLVS